MEKKEVKYYRNRTRQQALADADPDAITFPTDATTIIVGNKEYGIGEAIDTDRTIDPDSSNPIANSAVAHALTGKHGYNYYIQESSTLLSFADRAAFNQWQTEGSNMGSSLILSQVVISMSYEYQIILKAESATDFNITQSDTAANISVSFQSHRKLQSATSWTDFSEGAFFSVYVLVNNVYSLRASGIYVASGERFNYNVRPFLSGGNNDIVIRCQGARSGATSENEVFFHITLSSLSLTGGSFQWYIPQSGSTINIPLLVEGNVNKVIEYRLYKDGTQVYTKSDSIGTTSGNYTASMPRPSQDGVYHFAAWAHSTTGNLTTEAAKVEYDFIAAAPGSKSTFVVFSNIADKVNNYSEATLLDYSIYDAGNATSSLDFVLTPSAGGSPIRISHGNVATGSLQHLTTSLEVNATGDFDLRVVAQKAGASLNTATIPVDNTVVYMPVGNARYVINPSLHSNSEATRNQLFNDANGQVITAAKFNNVNFSTDGWTRDADGISIFRVLAGSSLDTGIYVFDPTSQRPISLRGVTLEVDAVIRNSFAEDQPIIHAANDLNSGSGWQGIKMFAEESIWHSQAQHTDSDEQNIQYRQGIRHHFTFVVYPDYDAKSGFNTVQMYIDGCKNRTFKYSSSDGFSINRTLVIGSQYGDVDLYGIRLYEIALTEAGVKQNYAASRNTTAEKAQVTQNNDVLDGRNVDYEACRRRFNVFVIKNTADNGNTAIPHWGDDSKYTSDWSFYFADNHEWDVTLKGVPIDGQGTSSKLDYYRWNLRGKCGSSTVWQYSRDSARPDTTKGGYFGNPLLYDWTIDKLTAKKNVASSMQSHKMGSVNSITDLARELNIYSISRRESIYQYPFVGFAQNTDEDGQTYYSFIGLYTVGPDKGDKNTFGYDTNKYPNLLMVEGSDNGPLATLFRVPWNTTATDFSYSEDDEALTYLGASAWDYDQGKPDSATEGTQVQQLMVSQFRPTYNWLHSTNRMIRPWSGTLDSLNNAIGTSSVNIQYEYWLTSNGNLYYYHEKKKRYELDDDGSYFRGNIWLQFGYTSLSSIPGSTNDAKNETLRQKRLDKFAAELETVGRISKSSSLFKANWDELHASTDTNAKNIYLFFRDQSALAVWLFDDTDTIFLSNNQGRNSKDASVEMYDDYKYGWDAVDLDHADTEAVYNGVTSVMWSNLRDAFYDPTNINCDGYRSMRDMITAMARLAGKSISKYAMVDDVLAYYDKYYFSQAQEYFPAALYNADTYYTYELVQYLADTNGIHFNAAIQPIRQALGDNQEPERNWIRKRIVYLMSKYHYGIFSTDSDEKVSFRASAGNLNFRLQYVYDMYHSVFNGTSIIIGDRIKARTASSISTMGQTDQPVGLLGASYITEVGDWSGFNINSELNLSVMTRLESFKLGGTGTVIASPMSLDVKGCTNLRTLDLRNVSSLGNTLDLSGCIHIQTVLAGGTQYSSIVLPNGGALTKIQYPATNQTIQLLNFPQLSDVDYSLCQRNISTLYIDHCGAIRGYKMLSDILDAQQGNVSLTYVRLTGIADSVSTSSSIASIAALLQSERLHGITADGLPDHTMYPVLEGTVNAPCDYYQSALDTIHQYCPNLAFTGLKSPYIEFADPLVQELVLQVVGDGVGVTKAMAKSQSVWGNSAATAQRFQGTDIITFDELEYFDNGSTIINYPVFYQCAKLTSVRLPDSYRTLGYNFFQYCTSLVDVKLPANLISVGDSFFDHCTSLVRIELPLYLSAIGRGMFHDCSSLSELVGGIPSSVTSISDTAFGFTTSLKALTIPATLTSMGAWSFESSGIETITFLGRQTYWGGHIFQSSNLKVINIPAGLSSIPEYAFSGCKQLTDVTISSTVTAIQKYAFSGCDAISTISIPSNVRAIEEVAFGSCMKLREAIFANGITTIGNSVFRGCPMIDHVDLPASITTIGEAAYQDVPSCRYVIIRATTPPTLPGIAGTFARCGADTPKTDTNPAHHGCRIFVPDSALAAYQSAPGFDGQGDGWGFPTRLYPLSDFDKYVTNPDTPPAPDNSSGDTTQSSASFDWSKVTNYSGKYMTFPYQSSLTSSYVSSSTQGAACYDKYYIQAFNKNHYLAVIDMSTKSLLASITLNSADVTNFHNNSIAFGVERVEASDPMPLLYLSSNNELSDGHRKILAYRIHQSDGTWRATLMQTIIVDGLGQSDDYPMTDMAIDRDNKHLYVGQYKMYKFSMPTLSQGSTITLDTSQAIGSRIYYQFYSRNDYPNNGFMVHNGKMYHLGGDVLSHTPEGMYLEVCSLDGGAPEYTIDMQALGYWIGEPQSMFVYNNDFFIVYPTFVVKVQFSQ